MGWFKSLTRSLSARLIALFTLAILPLGLISISQTQQIVDQADRRTNDALLARTAAAAAEEKGKIRNALGAAQGLAAAVPSFQSDEECSEAMRAFLASNPRYLFAGYVQRSGIMSCSTSEKTVDFTGFPGLEEFFITGASTVVVNQNGTVSQRPVFIVNTAVGPKDALTGFMSVSIPLETIASLSEAVAPDETGLALATVNQDGQIVAATGGTETSDSFLPRDIPHVDLLTRTGQIFPAVSGNGENRIYAVTSVIEDQVAMIGSWPTESSGGFSSSVRQTAALAFPLVMWLTGVAVAYIGLQRLVIRHIDALRSAMGRFAIGERDENPLSLNNPPSELAEAESAFNRLAATVSKTEDRREADLQDKEVLLKEVHHRVKNNLQLIASIMNMQARSAKTDETRETLAVLQQRVRGLAMLHRTLYTSPDLATVNGADLIRMVVKDVEDSVAVEPLKVELDLRDVELYPDQAVPLSMLVAEALTNAIKHGRACPDNPKAIEVRLTSSDDGKVRMSITNPLKPTATTDMREGGLGSKLMAAFVAQLEGEAEKTVTDTEFNYTMSFQQRAFEPVADALQPA